MPTQGERQNFLWRPNDNSSTTLLRYDLEAEHWMRAFNNAASKNKPVNYRESFAVIGLCISLTASLVTIALLLIIDFIKFILKLVDSKNAKKEIRNLEVVKQNNAKIEQIRSLIANRPIVFLSERTGLFKKAAKIVVLKQQVSISNLMFQLNMDFNTVCKIIDELYDAGIISDPLKGIRKRVLIKDTETLELLFDLEKE